jgi:hypothetical protein
MIDANPSPLAPASNVSATTFLVVGIASMSWPSRLLGICGALGVLGVPVVLGELGELGELGDAG